MATKDGAKVPRSSSGVRKTESAGTNEPKLPDKASAVMKQHHDTAYVSEINLSISVMFLYLTTTGRRTGRPREIEVWFTQRDGRVCSLAEDPDRAHWGRNI